MSDNWHDAQVIEATIVGRRRKVMVPGSGTFWRVINTGKWFHRRDLSDVRVIVDAEGRVVPPEISGPIAEVAAQRARNHAKWGELSIESRPPDYEGWLPTLGEEFGEVCRALTLEQGDPNRLRSELIDLLGVAWMWIDSIDRDHALGGGQ